MTKAETIRQFLVQHTNVKTKDAVERLSTQNPGMKFTPQEVSAVKGKLRAEGLLPPKGGEAANGGAIVPPPAPAVIVERPQEIQNGPEGPSVADKIRDLLDAARALGGAGQAREILDLFGEK